RSSHRPAAARCGPAAQRRGPCPGGRVPTIPCVARAKGRYCRPWPGLRSGSCFQPERNVRPLPFARPSRAPITAWCYLVESTCRDIDDQVVGVIEDAIQDGVYDGWTRSWDRSKYGWHYEPAGTAGIPGHRTAHESKPNSKNPIPAVNHPSELLPHLRDPSSRKSLLFSCAVANEIGPLLQDDRSRSFIACAERFADGGASTYEFQQAGHGAREASRAKGTTAAGLAALV